jgi:hypothetical protein
METVKLVVKWLLLTGGMLFWFFVFVNYLQPEERIYNCELAEISPDFPIDVKNECRRLKSGRTIST